MLTLLFTPFVPFFRFLIINTCLPITTQGVRRQFFRADFVGTLILSPFVSVRKKDQPALHEINHISSTVSMCNWELANGYIYAHH